MVSALSGDRPVTSMRAIVARTPAETVSTSVAPSGSWRGTVVAATVASR
jgi:hypothetical protein